MKRLHVLAAIALGVLLLAPAATSQANDDQEKAKRRAAMLTGTTNPAPAKEQPAEAKTSEQGNAADGQSRDAGRQGERARECVNQRGKKVEC
jgi:hypothetical protein